MKQRKTDRQKLANPLLEPLGGRPSVKKPNPPLETQKDTRQSSLEADSRAFVHLSFSDFDKTRKLRTKTYEN